MVDDRPARPRRAAAAPPAGVRVGARAARRGPRAGRGAQRRLARLRAPSGSRSSTTTSSPSRGWLRRAGAPTSPRAGPDVGRRARAGSSCRCPPDRRPTDWERNTPGLERARWATADLAYRRAALEAVGGFDERFPRAYREDADLGAARHRARAGGSCAARATVAASGRARRRRGCRCAKQAGNADDVLMRALHGRGWRERAGRAARAAGRATSRSPPRRRSRAGAAAAGRPRAAAAAARPGSAGTAELAWARIAPGPARRRARWRRCCGRARRSRSRPRAGGSPATRRCARRLRGAAAPLRAPMAAAQRGRAAAVRGAVLFDRDGTLVVDVPYNGDPARVRAGARRARPRSTALRAAGVPTAVVSNQSGVAAGCSAERRCARSTRASRSCSARSARGRVPARARRRLRLPQARARPGAAGGRARSASSRRAAW